MPSPLRKAHPPPQASPGTSARALRTLWMGLLLGLTGAILTLAGIAVVQRGPRGDRIDPTLPPEAAVEAAIAVDDAPSYVRWRTAAACSTPWGAWFRLRPYVEEVEVRGADVIIRETLTGSLGDPARRQPPAGGAPGVLTDAKAASLEHSCEIDPAALDWARLREDVRSWRRARPQLVRRLALDTGAALPSGPPCYAVILPEADPPWIAAMDVRLPDTGIQARRALARLAADTTAVPARGPADVRLTLDPQSLEIRSVEDLRISAGKAWVFNPNPIASGAPAETRDGDDVEGYRRPVLLERLDGSGRLRGLWIVAESRRAPEAIEPSEDFDYPSWDPRFEEAMAYYHGDRCVARAESLGFTGIMPRPLGMLLHATDVDNSWYSRVEHQIVLGDGGVDDAEDADIIAHEMGHALHDALVPGFYGGHSQAISEGFGDFWAASLTGDPCVGEWDATGYNSSCLRRVGGAATYSASLTGRPHTDGLIWSGLLWDLRTLLGRETAERLALAAFLEQSIACTYPEAGRGLIRAAEKLGLQEDLAQIAEAVSARGLIPREFDLNLALGEVRSVGLLDPADFLGRPVSAFVVSGDGTLRFSPDSRPILAEMPADLPMLRPGSGPDLPEGRSVHVRGTFSETRADLQQAWLVDGEVRARVTVGWSFEDGSLEWSYAEVSPDAPIEAELSVGAIPADEFVPIALDALPPGGLSGLRAFRGALPAERSLLLGASYQVEAERDGTFRLLQTARGLGKLPGGLELDTRPNPFRSSARLRLCLPRPAAVQITVFDTAGRRIRRLYDGPAPSGITEFSWDGADETGGPAPAGVYWIRAEGAAGRAASRLLRLR